MTKSYWKLGDKWAGITPRGKRFIEPTKAKAMARAGTKSPKTASKKKKTPKKTRSGGKTAKNSVVRAKKILGNLGTTGLLEDAAIGFFGANVLMGMGYPLESALPMTRVVQGIAGKALNRRGKGRLAYGVIDLIDVYLIRRGLKLPQTISLEAWR